MSISKAQLDLLNTKLLDHLGESPDVFDDPQFDDVLLNIARVLSKELEDSVTKKKIVATSRFRQSIDTTNVRPESDGYSVGILMLEYWRELEHGQKPGIWPEKKSLMEWIAAKGINPTIRKGQTKKQALDSLAQAIATKIHDKGTIKRFNYKGSGFIKAVLTRNNIKRISEHLAGLQAANLRAYIKT